MVRTERTSSATTGGLLQADSSSATTRPVETGTDFSFRSTPDRRSVTLMLTPSSAVGDSFRLKSAVDETPLIVIQKMQSATVSITII